MVRVYDLPMDEFAAAQQPRCEDCGTVMADIVGGYECSACGSIELIPTDAELRYPPVFRGRSIHGG